MHLRCSFCGRTVFQNKSPEYTLCSINCKKLFINKQEIDYYENKIMELLDIKTIQVSELQNHFKIHEKFKVVSAVRRLIYFRKFIKAKSKNEISQRSYIFKVKK